MEKTPLNTISKWVREQKESELKGPGEVEKT